MRTRPKRSLWAVVLAVCAASCSRDADVVVEPERPASSFPVRAADSVVEHPEELTDLWTRRAGVDWPDFLGPRRDGTSPEKGILTEWPAAGPRIVWQRELEGGYGIGSVSRGRFFQFDRSGNRAHLICMHAETGKTLWQFEYRSDYEDLYGYENGPRCSPVIDGNRVYIYGVEGWIHCLRVADGALVWKCDTAGTFGVIQNFFGVGSTPVIDGDLLIAVVGGSPAEDQNVPPRQLDRVSGDGTGIVAFDKVTGSVKYAISDELAGYASPVTATVDERRWCFALCRGGLLAFNPRDGEIDFHYPWRADMLESVNASSPVVVGNEVFISEAYSLGSSLLRVKQGGYDIVWRDDANRRQKSLKAHWNTPVYHEGYLYGGSGRNSPDAELRCVEWRTGNVMWSVRTRAHTSLLLVDGHLVCLDERGKLSLIRATPRSCEVTAEVTLREGDSDSDPEDSGTGQLLRYPCWAAPILSHGLLYVRGRDRLLCLELIEERG